MKEENPFDLLHKASCEKRNIELLGLLGDLIDEVKEVKVTYKENEKDPKLIDFFINERFIGNTSVQPKLLLDFRVEEIEQGFLEGAGFVIKKIFENIQK
jgi:hypothetical protein